MTFDEWLLHAAVYWQKNNQQRKGQAHFNTLYDIRPDLGQEIAGTHADPFHDDRRMTLFLDTVRAMW